MGFFDDIFADVKVFTDEIQGLKDELVSSVLDPTGELRDTVTEIAGELTGSGSNTGSSAYSGGATTPDSTQPTE